MVRTWSCVTEEEKEKQLGLGADSGIRVAKWDGVVKTWNGRVEDKKRIMTTWNGSNMKKFWKDKLGMGA